MNMMDGGGHLLVQQLKGYRGKHTFLEVVVAN